MKEKICQKCKYKWTPRVEEPRACPACKTYIKTPNAPNK